MNGSPAATSIDLAALRRLEMASIIEASTLVLLVGVAVPLKHIEGWSAGVSVLGPIHGVAFAFYCWTVLQTVVGGGWTRSEVARLFVAAVIPLGGFANVVFLSRKAHRLRLQGCTP